MKHSGEVLARQEFTAEITALDSFGSKIFISIQSGIFYISNFDKYKLVRTFTVKETFVRSICRIQCRKMLLVCQSGEMYSADIDDGILRPTALSLGPANEWNLVAVNSFFRVVVLGQRHPCHCEKGKYIMFYF